MREPYPDLEHRGNRSYDEQGVSTLVLPNGSQACSSDRELLGAMLQAVAAMRTGR